MWEPGSFHKYESAGIILGATQKTGDHVKELSSVTASQNSHLSEEYTFVKSMIAVFVLESTGNFLDK